MLRILSSLALLLFALPALATPPDAEAEVRALALAWLDAWNAHDADAVTALFADGALMAWAGGEEAALDDRDTHLANARAFFDYAASVDARLDHSITQVAVHDDIAVVFLSGTAHMGAPMPAHVQLTMAREASGDWRILAEHAMTTIER